MNNEEIKLTIKLMNGSGSDSAESILGFLAKSDFAAFKDICEHYQHEMPLKEDRVYDRTKGLDYFPKMTFHRLFESAISRNNLQLLDHLLKTDVLKARIHLLKDEANWFSSLLRSWHWEKETVDFNTRAIIDYLILDYGLPFNHHFKKIVESDDDYKEIGGIFKSRDLAKKLSKKLSAKVTPQKAKVLKI